MTNPQVTPQYGVVVADPPWNYNRAGKSGFNKKRNSEYKLSGYSNHQYEPLSTKDLCDMGGDIKLITSPDALLFMWTTWPFIKDSLDIIEAWGFTYVTGIPWVKVDSKLERPTYGVGYWFRGCTEPILVAKRGKSHRSNSRGILGFGDEDERLEADESVADGQGMLGYVSKPKGHSKKPVALQERIEEIKYPGPYLEMFGRDEREGWTVLGNEAPGDGMDIRDSIKGLIGITKGVGE